MTVQGTETECDKLEYRKVKICISQHKEKLDHKQHGKKISIS
jgi:hypothetical protein